jgi:hypothetical protein
MLLDANYLAFIEFDVSVWLLLNLMQIILDEWTLCMYMLLDV